MTVLAVTFTQSGPDVIVAYRATETETSTPIESEMCERVLESIQKIIAERGGSGKFIEKKAPPPGFPDFGQPREGGIAHGDDN
jgi:hypothetical protein